MMNSKGARKGRTEGRKENGGKNREVEGSRRGEGVGKRERREGRSYPCASGSSIFTLVFSTSQTAIGALQGTLHLVSSLLAHLQKVVCG